MVINTQNFDITPNPGALRTLPPELYDDASAYYERLKMRADADDMAVFESVDYLHYVLGMSDFIAKTLIQYPHECATIIREGALDSRFIH